VLLLSGARYFGSSEDEYAPLSYGTFERFKVVYRDGFITCDSGRPVSQYYWQTCNPHPGVPAGTIAYSFELKKNGEYVVEQPNWWTLPSECYAPASDTPTGDIVCYKRFTLAQGDLLTPTWYEPSHQDSTSDNAGSIEMDLYGFVLDQVKRSGIFLFSELAQ
jgi:hypothetical protein